MVPGTRIAETGRGMEHSFIPRPPLSPQHAGAPPPDPRLEEVPVNDDIILDIRNVTKRFPGVTALNDVSIQVRRGEIHGV